MKIIDNQPVENDSARAEIAPLLPESRDWWLEYVEEEEYPPTAEGLAEFIRRHLEPICIRMDAQARHHAAINAQTLGEGLQVQRLEKLARYETHLDRKFERNLAILVKLREMRGGGSLMRRRLLRFPLDTRRYNCLCLLLPESTTASVHRQSPGHRR